MDIFSHKKILKLYLNGEITSSESKLSTGNSVQKLKSTLLEVKQTNKDKYKGILLKINSPGGTAATSEELARLILSLREDVPVVVSIGDNACSGAYMIAAASNYIFANTMSWTGSVGVIMTLPNYQELAKKLGVSIKTIKSGKMKDLGNPFREMTPEEEIYLETLVKKAHEEFVNFIKLTRPNAINLDELADGRVLDARTALENNLIDRLGTEDDALTFLITEILHGNEKDFSVTDTAPKPSFLKKILDMAAPITIKLELPNNFPRL
ncbi:MAG: signal peptide peptidase SppA [Selenomonadaceae bacterium]|nr:signal peptide peptidase SppA [Selenomonadaceae bacterium]MBR6887574.1 signal peptide peptidase SppA [Selenomonadaceae bacterium]